ncbi:hypothetical protein HUJ04_001480 [Dendroctonus ponderosae]|nr:hypothetical protein HUJ04_001480 [Dendroctonus ponderosae]
MGFSERRGTMDAFLIRTVWPVVKMHQQREVYMCCIDYTKAFDCINPTTLLELQERIGVDAQDIKIVQNLYEQQVASVKQENIETSTVPTRRVVRRGFPVPPVWCVPLPASQQIPELDVTFLTIPVAMYCTSQSSDQQSVPLFTLTACTLIPGCCLVMM